MLLRYPGTLRNVLHPKMPRIQEEFARCCPPLGRSARHPASRVGPQAERSGFSERSAAGKAGEASPEAEGAGANAPAARGPFELLSASLQPLRGQLPTAG